MAQRALDFAYAVGPAIGNIATGADINHKHGKLMCWLMVILWALTRIKCHPTRPIKQTCRYQQSPKWDFKISKASAWRPKIQYGKQALDRALGTYGKSITDLTDDDWTDILKWRGIQYAWWTYWILSTGMLLPQLVVSRLLKRLITADDHTRSKHLLAGIKGVEVVLHAAAIRFMAIPLLGICLT